MRKLAGDCCVLYILCVPGISEVAACLSNMCYLACVTCKFIDTALDQFLCITGVFGFMSCCKVLVALNAIPMLVCSKRFVIFFIFGL